MFRLLVVLALLSCLYGLSWGQHHGGKKHGQKIAGGQETTIEKHPSQVSLMCNNGKLNFTCGGSIISEHWILTAAHCTTKIIDIVIRAGSTNLHSGGITYRTTNFTVHPQHNVHMYDFDAAVLYVPERMKLNNTTMKVIKLATSKTSTPVGTITTISGWGHTEKDTEPSEKLRSVQVPIMSLTICREIYRQMYIPLTDDMLCAGYPEEMRDSCLGDSGGPLVLENGEQVGIAAFGKGWAWPYLPGIYAKVASVRSWIQMTTGV